MKLHWRTAHISVREQVEALLAQPYKMSDGRMSEAHSWKRAADLVWSRGYDLDPPRSPVSEKLAELRAAKDFSTINRLHLLNGASFEEEAEKANVIRYGAMAKWRAQPSAEEQAAESLKQAEAARLEALVEARAQQLLADANGAALEQLRKQARKEISGAAK
jgi:hypothetical protein